jgi:long-subunit fatty acid transport protein
VSRLIAIGLVLSVAASARAYPLLAPRPVESAIAGPSDPHVAAIFYNPAALGPLRGVHFWMDGAARIHEGDIDRGYAGAGSTRINYADTDAFVGVSWDFNSDAFRVGVGAMVPYTDLGSFGGSATGYHSTAQTYVDFQQTVAVAIKISSRFYFGASASAMESWMSWHFDRDAALAGGSAGVYSGGGLCGAQPCGFENPAAREQLRVRGFSAGWTISAGLLAHVTDRLWLGASYLSHTFNGQAGSELQLHDEKGTRVSGPGVSCGGQACVGNSSVNLYIPDVVMAALRVELTPRTEIETTLRWIHYSERAQLDLQTQGGNLSQLPPSLALPPSMRRDLGLQDTFGAELSLRFRLNDKLRLSPSLFFETSAVEASAVSAAALDAPKLDLALTAEWKPIKHLVLGAHVGGTAYMLGNVHSRNSPTDTVRCVDAQYSLDRCGAVVSGDGLPQASGKYSLFVVHLGAAVGFDY